MANPEQNQEAVLNIVFRGTDGHECEEFIGALEDLALTQGWSGDRERMLNVAKGRLRNKALRWFVKLDLSVQNDWNLFVQALFEEYPPIDAAPRAEAWSTTTFSPCASISAFPSDKISDSQSISEIGSQVTEKEAPEALCICPTRGQAYHYRSAFSRPLKYDASLSGRQVGILRIVGDGGAASPHYVWRGPTFTYSLRGGRSHSLSREYSDIRKTTTDWQEALVVCFLPSPEPHQIGILNARHQVRDLALEFPSPYATSYALCEVNDVVTLPQEKFGSRRRFTQIWNLLTDGTLQATLAFWEKNPNNNQSTEEYIRRDFTTSEVHLDISGSYMSFVKPGTPLAQDGPGNNTCPVRPEFRAHVVFEPL